MSTAKLVLFHKPNQKGEYTINLYVRIRGKVFRRSTGFSVISKKWDVSGMKIKGKTKDILQINQVLHQKLAEANSILRDYELMQMPLTKSLFIKELETPMFRGDFLDYFKEESRREFDRRMIQISTYNSECRTLRKLTEFQPVILFSQFDRLLLEKFDAWHNKRLIKKGYEGKAERERALKHIHKYLLKAKQEFQMDKRLNFKWPFENFRWPKRTNVPVFLTEKEVLKLEELYESPERVLELMRQRAVRLDMTPLETQRYVREGGVERIRKVLRMFLRQCYSGVRYSDVNKIALTKVNDNHIIFKPTKTKETSGKEVRMYITAKIRRYIALPAERMISNQKYNLYLKEVAELAGINKHLTTHVGRHTFATLCIKKGIGLPVLAELMGVKIDTAMIYVHLTDTTRDQQMIKAFGA